MMINVRYFIVDYDNEDVDLLEVTEQEFIMTTGNITYDRHTKHVNGCDQICLTKGLDL